MATLEKESAVSLQFLFKGTGMGFTLLQRARGVQN